MVEELPKYRAITRVTIGDGETTAFWHDRWLLNTTLASTFPALFSHFVKPHILVSEALHNNLTSQLRPRLSRCGREEKQLLQDCLLHITLTDMPDVRVIGSSATEKLCTRDMYHALRNDTKQDPDALRLWSTSVPSKVKFFSWLLHHDRLNCRELLFRRNIRSLEDSYCERCREPLETSQHIFDECPMASDVWALVNINIHPGAHRQPWFLGKDLPLPSQISLDVVMMIMWEIWKARNALIFDRKTLTAHDILRRVLDDLDSWSCRFGKLRHMALLWRDYLYHCL